MNLEAMKDMQTKCKFLNWSSHKDKAQAKNFKVTGLKNICSV